MKAVIMAGGRGTRISSVASDIPKPMIDVCGMPVLERETECLKAQGFCDIIMTVGHLADKIINYFGDGSGISPATGRPFGVHIEYFVESQPMGNAGALYKLRDRFTEDFLLLNADSLFDIDFSRFIAYHRKKGGLATIFTHPNSHPYDSGLIVADGDGRVRKWLTREDERPEYYANRVNAGLHILSPKLLDMFPASGRADLDRDILKPLVNCGGLYCYDSPEYVRDMGTPERYAAVCEDVRRGIVGARNLINRQRAIFLDRDGTINKYVGFLKSADDFVLADGAAQAIKLINESGRLAIVATNQPVIARGEMTVEELDRVHDKMQTLLGREGAYLDAIYYCPHHPDKGFEGERPEYKVDCNCRKPKAGMLLSAAERFNIDLSQSWMIGDGENDVLCGRNAGCSTAAIGGIAGADVAGEDLFDCVRKILNERKSI